MFDRAPTDDVDLFAGPGGWDEGVRPLGIHPLGIELDTLACATAEAAGHRRLRADIAGLDPATVLAEHGIARLRGEIASPPCQGFSGAGRGRGRDDADALLAAIPHMPDRDVRSELRDRMSDPRSVLVLEPLRWALALDPEWCAWEQVPAVLPVWEACAAVLRARGYHAATGILRAEQYGVPQVRKRAVLVARRGSPVALPAPTHSRYHPTNPARLDAGLMPWVPMADAVGWGFTQRPSQTLVSQTAGGPRLLDGGSGAWEGVLRAVDAGHWIRRPDRLHLPLNRGEVSTCPMVDGARLQSFPAHYPWQGPVTQQAKQIGNAVPPLLARAVLAAVAGQATGTADDGTRHPAVTRRPAAA